MNKENAMIGTLVLLALVMACVGPPTPTAPPVTPLVPTAPPLTVPPTAPPVTSVPTPIPPTPTPEGPAGWLLYTNPIFGYRFYYPPDATIIEYEIQGFPTDELPEGMTTNEYIAQLQATYDNALCVEVRYEAGYIDISAPPNEGHRYTICGRTGVGVGTMTDRTETVLIAGGTYTAKGFEFLCDEGTDLLPCHNETLVLTLPGGTRIEYGSAPMEGSTYTGYVVSTKPVLIQILNTFLPGP